MQKQQEFQYIIACQNIKSFYINTTVCSDLTYNKRFPM